MRYSVERHGGPGVVVRGLYLSKLPITRQGATEFTFSRFLVPWLCNYEGYAVFCDEDQVVVDDITELVDYCRLQDNASVYVNQAQPRFEWPSVMVFDCSKCTKLTPEYIEDESNVLFDFAWAEGVGRFPPEWNHCVAISESRTDAKLYHYTQGIPWWPECRGPREDKFWWDEYNAMVKSVEWMDLHSNTVHFKPVIQRMLATKYGLRMVK